MTHEQRMADWRARNDAGDCGRVANELLEYVGQLVGDGDDLLTTAKLAVDRGMLHTAIRDLVAHLRQKESKPPELPSERIEDIRWALSALRPEGSFEIQYMTAIAMWLDEIHSGKELPRDVRAQLAKRFGRVT